MLENIDELKKLPFEQALEKLEETVGKMESGNLPLDQMISCFEQGNALKNICSHKLNDLEKKIEVLVREDAHGGEWKEFDVENSRECSISSQAQPIQQQTAPTQPIQQTQVVSVSRPAPNSNDMLF